MKVGQLFTREIGKCEHRILTLSSDIEPGIEWECDVYRCAQFQVGSNGQFFGAQIVLYTEAELNSMLYSGTLNHPTQPSDEHRHGQEDDPNSEPA